jgi:hypothetical protein
LRMDEVVIVYIADYTGVVPVVPPNLRC